MNNVNKISNLLQEVSNINNSLNELISKLVGANDLKKIMQLVDNGTLPQEELQIVLHTIKKLKEKISEIYNNEKLSNIH